MPQSATDDSIKSNNFKPYYQMILQGGKPAIMSVKINSFCRKCSLIMGLLLLLQVGKAQKDFSKVGGWLRNNVKELGGRAVLVVYKNGVEVKRVSGALDPLRLANLVNEFI